MLFLFYHDTFLYTTSNLVPLFNAVIGAVFGFIAGKVANEVMSDIEIE